MLFSPCLVHGKNIGTGKTVAMPPVIGPGQLAALMFCVTLRQRGEHINHISAKGFVSEFNHGLVHEPIPVKGAMRIPEAKTAVDKEWNKLDKLLVRDYKKVRLKAEVIKQAEKDGRTVHFTSLMDLCSQVHPKHLPKYKGRVVRRGDNVKYHEGTRAGFTEKGASASQLAAATLLDTISLFPGMAGEANDAVSAYTQVRMSDGTRPSRLPEKECLQV